jgi:hypothetical protein
MRPEGCDSGLAVDTSGTEFKCGLTAGSGAVMMADSSAADATLLAAGLAGAEVLAAGDRAPGDPFTR